MYATIATARVWGDRQAGHSAVRHTIQDDIDDFFVGGSMSELRMAKVDTGYEVAVGPMASNSIERYKTPGVHIRLRVVVGLRP